MTAYRKFIAFVARVLNDLEAARIDDPSRDHLYPTADELNAAIERRRLQDEVERLSAALKSAEPQVSQVGSTTVFNMGSKVR